MLLKLFSSNGDITISKNNIAKLVLTTPNAPKEDMEALMIDPISKNLFTVTKNFRQRKANIYKISLLTQPSPDNAPVMMDLVGM